MQKGKSPTQYRKSELLLSSKHGNWCSLAPITSFSTPHTAPTYLLFVAEGVLADPLVPVSVVNPPFNPATLDQIHLIPSLLSPLGRFLAETRTHFLVQSGHPTESRPMLALGCLGEDGKGSWNVLRSRDCW